MHARNVQVDDVDDEHVNWIVAALGVAASISLILGILAWGIRNEKRWAWLPAAGFAVVFAMAFPIGTIISYFALSALWKCRESFFPFSTNIAEQE